MSMLRTALKVFATHSFRMLLGCELPIRGETWKGDMGNVGAGILLLSAQVLIVVAFLGYRSKRKNAEADLIRSNERLRLAMELGKSVGWDWDIASGCETWFGDLRTFFGIASHTHTARFEDFFGHIHPEDRQRVAEAVADARRNSKPYSAEFRIVSPNGGTRWVASKGEFQYGTDGSARRMLGLAVDVTESKRIEEALKKSEEKFSKAFRQSPLMLTLTSAKDGRFLEVNETKERITGWRREEFIGRTSVEMGIWADLGQRAELTRRLSTEGSVRNFEVNFRTRDGDVRLTLVSAELIEINGEPCILSVATDITDLARAERATQTLEDRFSQFFATVPEYCYIISPEGNILDVNPAACEALGCSKEELVGRPWFAIYAPESHSRLAELTENWKRKGKLRNEEMVIQTRRGEKRTVLLNVGSVVDADRNVLQSACVQVDITERKLADAALRQSEERFRLAMNNVAAGLYTLDLQGLVTYVNPAAEAMLGWTSAELVGKNMHDVAHYMHSDGTPFPASDCARLQVLQHGIELREHEDVFIRKNGNSFPVVYSASPLIRDGKTVGIVVGFRDDTYRRQADQAMRESEERFRLVANSAPVTIWMSDVNNLCIWVNQRWVEFTGRPLETQLGDGWTENVHPEDLGRCMDIFMKASYLRESFQVEYRLRRYDGEYSWMVGSGVPRFNGDGSFAGYIGSAFDATEIKQAEQVLSTLSQRLIEAHEQERTWIARELHDDIGQRLALLMMRLEGLKPKLPASFPELRHEIQDAGKQLEGLGSDIQILSRSLHPSKLQYLGLVQGAASFCSELSATQKVEIDFQSENIPADLPQEISLCLYRVLQEALQNAIKHSGSRRFEVFLGGSSKGIHLAVHDSGVGFDPVKAMKGHGLGLTSMKERLKLVNGSLFIDSQLHHGATIDARVPLNQRTAAGAAGKI